MFSFLTALSPRIYLGIALVVIAIWGVSYVNNLKSDLVEERQAKEDTQTKLDEANTNNGLIIQAYELTLKVEKEIADEKAIALEQKIEVTKTTSKVKEAVIKRGEIKSDEKSNFTIVTF